MIKTVDMIYFNFYVGTKYVLDDKINLIWTARETSPSCLNIWNFVHVLVLYNIRNEWLPLAKYE